MFSYKINDDMSVEILRENGSVYLLQTTDPRNQTAITTQEQAESVGEFLVKSENNNLLFKQEIEKQKIIEQTESLIKETEQTPNDRISQLEEQNAYLYARLIDYGIADIEEIPETIKSKVSFEMKKIGEDKLNNIDKKVEV